MKRFYANTPEDQDLDPAEGPHVTLKVSRGNGEWVSVDLPLVLLPVFYWAAFGIADDEQRSWEVDAGIHAAVQELGYTVHGAVGPERAGLYLRAWVDQRTGRHCMEACDLAGWNEVRKALDQI